MRRLQYEKLTWPEIKEAVQRDVVVLIPTGAIEEHGHHLPLDTDVVIARGICMEAARRLPDQVLVMPPLWFGYETHHMDFHGTIDIPWQLFVQYGMAVTLSLAHHGFRRLLIVNGHGSNRPLVELIARQTTVERPHVLCAAMSWWELSDAQRAFNAVRESEVTSHACELETSAYLALEPEGVQMDKAARDMNFPMSQHIWSDLMGRKPDSSFKAPIRIMEHWSTVSLTGVRGDPTRASAEKGRAVIAAAAAELADIVMELRQRQVRMPVDRH